MKTLLACASLVLLSAGSAFAGDGQVADSTLAKMGLSNMQVMTDAQGMDVRGMALVAVNGYSTAHNRNAESYNQYSASGFKYAKGGSISFVGTIGHHSLKVNFAGGGAFANAR